ncbi:11809_t:CDS:10 [Funneliformis mosseae]|uniref:11809_t:CDS:1 n=1 Tax=Funneliformis mosseae TaxID=27381 RepID=A0A9N9I028_FUNMO|nr:11809_t:CDS:10 [Funneliformis mosseae]
MICTIPIIKILVEIVTYLNSKESSYWSFPDFLSSNFEAIVNFPPDTNDIKGLSGTWLKRFMLEAKAKGFEYKISKVLPESGGSVLTVPPMCDISFYYGSKFECAKIFNDVISARLDILRQQNITILKSKVKIIADEKGINLVTASSEFHGSQMIAEYSQNQNSLNITCYLFSKSSFNPFEICAQIRNIKRQKDPSEETPAHDDESDNESIMSDSPLYDEFVREMKMADETKEYYSDPESTESVNDDDDDYVYISDNDNTVVDDSKLKTKIEFTEFEKTYLKMNDSDKWILSTGKIVDDVLYNFGIKCRHEHLCHSFVIDPNDNIYIDEEVFTETELDEIRKYKLKPMPHINAIFKSQKWDSPYNRQTYFDHDWIRNTAYNLLHEHEAGSLEKDHLELWLLVHVWNFVDRGFGNVDGLETARSESSSRASSNRKNRNRTGSAIVKMKRKIMGRRGDLIIRKVSTEYGCSEAGKSFEGNNGTKLLHERGIKAPKMMKDMFYSLCEAVGNEEKKIRKLQSIGFIHSGLMILLLRLNSPAGYTCRITRTKMLEIPSQITQFGSKVLPVIMLAWKAKMIVKETIEFIEQKQYSDDE